MTETEKQMRRFIWAGNPGMFAGLLVDPIEVGEEAAGARRSVALGYVALTLVAVVVGFVVAVECNLI